MTSPEENGASYPSASGVGPIPTSERLAVLDILRGVAILGMFVVHFISFFGPFEDTRSGGAIGNALHQAVELFGVDKFSTMFVILIGVGFAVQLRRADARGEDIRWRFLRRLLGVAGFGVVTALSVNAFDLIQYAYAGVWLLVVRRWSTKALLFALVFSATFGGLWRAGVGAYNWATVGADQANVIYKTPPQLSPARQAALADINAYRSWQIVDEGPRPTSSQLVAARFEFWVAPFVTDLWKNLPLGKFLRSLADGNVMLFLVGLLALRIGVFDRPADHRRAIVGAMGIGAALWALNQFEVMPQVWPPSWVIPVQSVARPVQFYPLFLYSNSGYLGLTYMGGIILLVSSSAAWRRMLSETVGAAGRLALTNYLLHFAVLAVFGHLGFARVLTPQRAILDAIILFGALVLFSRWWLARFRLGPAEWVLRSLTYARLQPIRLAAGHRNTL